MFKFVILAACVAVASAGHLAAESAILSADPLTYSNIPLGLSSHSILGSPLSYHAAPATTIIRSAPLIHSVPSAAIIKSAPLIHSVPSTTIIRSSPLSLHSAPVLSQSSLNIVKSAPLTLTSSW